MLFDKWNYQINLHFKILGIFWVDLPLTRVFYGWSIHRDTFPSEKTDRTMNASLLIVYRHLLVQGIIYFVNAESWWKWCCFYYESFKSVNLLNASKQNSDEIAWPDSSLPCAGETSLTSVVLKRHTGSITQMECTTLSNADVLCHSSCLLCKVW